ncbi:hypothetical protein [Brachyspira innocens]|uniref:hypothetical protein n=1 Tax=Brachyspira innocens TaxID=13264 RepID=UPI0026EC5C41|nr:hypothetical protein [Brachyspira innocens]
MKKSLIILFILLCLSNIVFAKGLPLSTEVTGEDYSWIKGRQMISLNFNPGVSVFSPMLVNTIFTHGKHIAGFLGVNFGTMGDYLNYAEVKGTSWFLPSVTYSLFVHNQIALEAGIGIYGSTYLLNISKENASKLLDSMGQGDYATVIASDTKFRSSFVFMPTTFGVRFYGKKRQFYNAFRLGIDAFFYTIETENGLTGIKTSQSVSDAAVYVSYEIGWNIELFPTKEWRVKPMLDIGLLEIGYYVRPWTGNLYSAVQGNLGILTAGFAKLPLPAWESVPGWAQIISNLRIGLFPRIGVSIRF